MGATQRHKRQNKRRDKRITHNGIKTGRDNPLLVQQVTLVQIVQPGSG
jgi:hypothetical protein